MARMGMDYNIVRLENRTLFLVHFIDVSNFTSFILIIHS